MTNKVIGRKKIYFLKYKYQAENVIPKPHPCIHHKENILDQNQVNRICNKILSNSTGSFFDNPHGDQ